MQVQADEDELGLSTAALAALKEFALENNLLDLDGDSDLDVRLQVQDHMDVKERAHDFCFTFEDYKGHDEQVSIGLTGVNPELGQTLASTGLTVWRAAQEMARFMWEHRRWFAGKRVVELGAGLGLCGVLASKLCVGGTVVITDGGEEFTDSAMEALRRNLEKNSCNLSQEWKKRMVAESADGDGDDGWRSGTAPRCPQRSAGTGARRIGSGNDENDDDGDEYGSIDGNGNSDDADDFVGGGKKEGGACGAQVLLERLTWGEHADFLERHGGDGGCGGDGSAVVDGEGEGGGNDGVGGCGGGGGGFDFIVAADVIYEEAAVSPLLHTVVDILKLRTATDSCRQWQQQQKQEQQQQQQQEQQQQQSPPPPQTPPSCPPAPSVSTFLLAFARRNISIDRVLGEAESLGLMWRVPENFTPTSSSENIYLMCLA